MSRLKNTTKEHNERTQGERTQRKNTAKERNESARLKTPPEALHSVRWRRLPVPDELTDGCLRPAILYAQALFNTKH